MYDIIAEKASIIYYPIDEPVDYSLFGRFSYYMEPNIVNIQQEKNLRIVVLNRGLDYESPYYLFWWDQTDLVQLDDKVKNGTYSDQDFTNSINTIYQRTFCTYCHAKFATLVIPSGEGYIGVPNLQFEKIKRYVRDNKFLTCLNCGKLLWQMVVRIFYQIEA